MTMLRLDRVESLIDAGGWTTSELAESCGVNYHFIYRLRRGDWNDIRARHLVALARALETSTDFLLDLTDDPRPSTTTAGLSVAESHIIYDIAGAEDDVRQTIVSIQRLSPDQRSIMRQVADQMVAPGKPRIIGSDD